MKLKVDLERNALYLRLDESAIVESEQVKPGVILDYDEKNNVVGIELLNIRERANEKFLKQLQFETV
ncbi:MAG: DUF2283 domain-containing protein [Ignavibacteriales bacterium]|nr:DUF2283 domain-containing protein [Ignavibacteriales bacterium]